MKPPEALREQLRRHWHNNPFRVGRLLGRASWPLTLSIGAPASQQVLNEVAAVQKHIRAWQAVKVGRVEFGEKSYRGLAAPIRIPLRWHLGRPSEWVAACDDPGITAEFSALSQLAASCTEEMRELLIRERSLWRNKPLIEVEKAIKLARQLEPDCAQGQPLRLLAGYGVDTKFFERHASLLCRLLDTRYSGVASQRGLSGFLGAQDEKDHWLLVKPLCDGLLPFSRLRLTDALLMQAVLPARRLLLVENEHCEHVLPVLEDCIAILGAGANLAWLGGRALDGKQLYYWGDLDSWGLTLLGRAREIRPELQSVLMTGEIFQAYQEFAVPEPQVAARQPHSALTHSEATLYVRLRELERGRLEQEYIPACKVQEVLRQRIRPIQ